MAALRQFERMYAQFKAGKKKKGVLITCKMQMETFVLMAKENIIGMVSVNHHRTTREPADVLSQYMAFAKQDIDRSFINKLY